MILSLAVECPAHDSFYQIDILSADLLSVLQIFIEYMGDEKAACALSHTASTQSLSHINSLPPRTQFPSKTVISMGSLLRSVQTD